MMLATPTHYSSLPSMPQMNALPQGVPSGPWGPLYRSAPGAQIPGVRYPGMRGAGLGAGMPVQIVGGLGNEAGQGILGLVMGALVAGGTGAAIGLAVHGKRPVLYPALTLGSIAIVSAAINWAMK